MTSEQAMLEAAARMQSAADKMAQAAKDIDFALMNHQRFLKDFLERVESSLHDFTEVMPNADEPVRVLIVKHLDEDKEDTHEAKTVPAPADHGPIELEGAVS